ncbi:hypothetical protein [Candidatus Galacturonibacter soehngenii]|uniref:Uncharacterized protein n=1 Tax=Candidatus Galacturonatibacter soehngenii TaxID=2307010 RepID=A0A7V7QJH0_9FIRM|nr:hypothetical protein [Candidatus Galacturonibacter soehngenii]KAB1436580.1 hypothetical protein F7O84_14565 [Candidatus Galacturonibacter soehngenii]
MKVKLTDGTIIEAQVKEEKNTVTLITEVATLNDLSFLYNQFTNFNLSNVVVTYTDGTFGAYKNLKTIESTWSKKANVISTTITLTSKTEFEMKVDELEKEAKSNLTDLTQTQIALTEVYEMLLNM